MTEQFGARISVTEKGGRPVFFITHTHRTSSGAAGGGADNARYVAVKNEKGAPVSKPVRVDKDSLWGAVCEACRLDPETGQPL